MLLIKCLDKSKKVPPKLKLLDEETNSKSEELTVKRVHSSNLKSPKEDSHYRPKSPISRESTQITITEVKVE